MMTFCIRTTRDGSFSSGIWKYGVGRNCEFGCDDCDQAAAATMPDARMAAGTISLFIVSSLGLLRPSAAATRLARCARTTKARQRNRWGRRRINGAHSEAQDAKPARHVE